jgi:hypothetical protein
MSQSAKVRERIQTLDERLARLRSEKNRLMARASQTERKRDTRRKILIGGAVLAAIDHEGVPSLQTKTDLLAWLTSRLTRPHDRAVFDFAVQESIATPTANRTPIAAATSTHGDTAGKSVGRSQEASRRGAKGL